MTSCAKVVAVAQIPSRARPRERREVIIVSRAETTSPPKGFQPICFGQKGQFSNAKAEDVGFMLWALRREGRCVSSDGVNTFDRHLLREWLQILGLVLAITCGLLLVQVFYDDFRTLRENGARGWELWTFVGTTMPSFFAVVLPIALLISLLFTLGKLHRANELTAMRAAGVGFMRLTAPVWVVGLFCCGLSWWLNTTVVPWSVESSRSLEDSLQFRHDSSTLPPDRIGATPPFAFDNQRDGRMWQFNRFSQHTQKGYGVTVSQLDSKRRELRRIEAAEAWFDPARKGWVFKGGWEVAFDPERAGVESQTPFTEQLVENFQEQPQLMILLGRRAEDM